MTSNAAGAHSRLFLPDEDATIRFGARLVAAGIHPAVIYLHGDLAAGKTTLCRGIIQALGHAGAVKSPTYTIVEPYVCGANRIYHFDLYRLGAPEELEYLGIRDYVEPGVLLLIEWPEHGAGHLPAADLHLSLRPDAGGRYLEWWPESSRGKEIMAGLNAVSDRA